MNELMKYRKGIMWFVGGGLVGTSIGIMYGGAYGFLFAGLFILGSLFLNQLLKYIF